jgi:hypothetical protein
MNVEDYCKDDWKRKVKFFGEKSAILCIVLSLDSGPI